MSWHTRFGHENPESGPPNPEMYGQVCEFDKEILNETVTNCLNDSAVFTRQLETQSNMPTQGQIILDANVPTKTLWAIVSGCEEAKKDVHPDVYGAISACKGFALSTAQNKILLRDTKEDGRIAGMLLDRFNEVEGEPDPGVNFPPSQGLAQAIKKQVDTAFESEFAQHGAWKLAKARDKTRSRVLEEQQKKRKADAMLLTEQVKRLKGEAKDLQKAVKERELEVIARLSSAQKRRRELHDEAVELTNAADRGDL